MHTLAAQGIEVCRQGRDEGLTLAGAHFGDIAVVEHHATDELDVERAQSERAPSRLSRDREGLRQQLVQRLAVREAALELFRQVERLQAILERIDAIYGLAVLTQHALVAAAEDTGKKFCHLGLLRDDFSARHLSAAHRGWTCLRSIRPSERPVF